MTKPKKTLYGNIKEEAMDAARKVTATAKAKKSGKPAPTPRVTKTCETCGLYDRQKFHCGVWSLECVNDKHKFRWLPMPTEQQQRHFELYMKRRDSMKNTRAYLDSFCHTDIHEGEFRG
jgi:hypothetical protein